MIISNKHQFVFVAIPKTATHAIRFALRQHLDEKTDWEQVGLFVKKSLPFESLAKLGNGHIKCTEIQPFLEQNTWNNYFKFTIVRNPYDRFISYCFFMNREDITFKKYALERMKKIIVNKKVHQNLWFIPQYHFITDNNGELMVDFVGKYENLVNAHQHICTKIGIPSEQLPRINRSIHNNYAEYYDDELRQAVFEFYQPDFDLLGYGNEIS
ncbi:MAG: sulfotransferase family 2 domain-containing protein [Thiomargarita sp.]|nr:sulfotransferase family 2 domain-containing protein [Thiomargarita sp.]